MKKVINYIVFAFLLIASWLEAALSWILPLPEDQPMSRGRGTKRYYYD